MVPSIYQNVGATYVTLPHLTLQMIRAETASLLTDDNNCGFEKFGNSGLHGRFVLSWISRLSRNPWYYHGRRHRFLTPRSWASKMVLKMVSVIYFWRVGSRHESSAHRVRSPDCLIIHLCHPCDVLGLWWVERGESWHSEVFNDAGEEYRRVLPELSITIRQSISIGRLSLLSVLVRSQRKLALRLFNDVMITSIVEFCQNYWSVIDTGW